MSILFVRCVYIPTMRSVEYFVIYCAFKRWKHNNSNNKWILVLNGRYTMEHRRDTKQFFFFDLIEQDMVNL